MALLSKRQRQDLGKGDFALPANTAAKAAGEAGRYPIPDAAHARNALARAAQHGTPTEQAKVRAAVKKRFPSIKQGKG